MTLSREKVNDSHGFTSAIRLSTSHFDSGFSLVEVTIALGIISVALFALIGLFPVGLKLANDAQYESRAIMIAQNLFSELALGSSGNASIAVSADWAVREGGWLAVNLTVNETYYVVFNAQGTPMGRVANAGPTDAGLYLARVNVSPRVEQPGLSQVDVTISVPARVVSNKRAHFNFVSLLPNR